MDPLEQEKLNLQREEIVEKIKGYLRHANTLFEDVVHPEIRVGDIVIRVKGKGEIDQPKVEYFISLPDDIDCVKISTNLYFDQSDRVGFKLLKENDKLIFVNNLRIPLLILNVGYTWLPDLHNFESLELSKQIFFDGFNKHTFFETVSAVMHGYEVALAKYEEFRRSV
jgi:hypothetical protein